MSGGECTPDQDEYTDCENNNNSTRCSGELPLLLNQCDILYSDYLYGRIAPVGDADWYWVEMGFINYASVCFVDVEVELTNIPSDTDYDLCVYWINDDGSFPEITCSDENNFGERLFGGDWEDFEGAYGCCSINSSNADELVLFDPPIDAGTLVIKVWSEYNHSSCDEYRLDYHF